MLTSLIPYVYCTGKLKYQEALLFDLREKITMPERVHRALYDFFGTCCNFTGNPQSWQHNDEGLESMAVKVIKEGATQGTEGSIITSFYTINERSRIIRKAMSSVVRPPGAPKGNSTRIRDSRILCFDDRVRATAECVLRMFRRLSGNIPDTPCKFPFYGAEHRAHPVLINPVSDDFLE